MILRLNFKRALTYSFVALGPLGNMLTPHFFPDSFRTYYFLLPLFPIYFLLVRERIAKIGILFLPFLIYSYFSAHVVDKFGDANEPHTVFRFYLLICQFFFIIGAASALKKKEEVLSLLKTYLTFYSLSLAAGYVFFIGYYLKIFPFSVLARFSVLTQFGFGLLRFSPGSYPNEYGIVSSFVLSVLAVIFLDKKYDLFNFSRKWFAFFFLSTFLAFLLTTTRAAYLSFLVSVIYLSWKSGYFIRVFTSISLFILGFFCFLLLFKINMFDILSHGFTQRFDEGSLGDRYFMWLETIEHAKEDTFWGAGFASLTNVHNVYLQLLFELGFVGTVLLLGSLFISFIESFFRHKRPIPDEISPFLSKIRMVGLINVLSFAASNHNLNHHLTWFVCFLCFASLRLPYLISQRRDSSIPEGAL
jgi:O-antigen ligase